MTATATSATSAPAAARRHNSPRRRLPRQERARQLLDVAEAVFVERGVQSSSMDDIATAAGITKPVLYDHFGSKDRLLAAVVLRSGTVLGETVMAAVSASTTPEDALAHGLGAYFEFIEQRISGLHTLLTEGVPPGSEAAAAMETVRDQQAELIAGLLIAQSATPDPTQAQLYAQIVIGATERLATRPGNAERPSVDVLTRHVMDVIWCGFATLRDGERWEPNGGSGD